MLKEGGFLLTTVIMSTQHREDNRLQKFINFNLMKTALYRGYFGITFNFININHFQLFTLKM